MMVPQLDIESLDKEEIMEDIERARQNRLWLTNSVDKLRERFANLYIAVDQGEVIGHHKDMKALVSILREKYENITFIAIEYVPEKEYIIVI